MSSEQIKLVEKDIETIKDILSQYDVEYLEENDVSIKISGYDFNGKHYHRFYIQVN